MIKRSTVKKQAYVIRFFLALPAVALMRVCQKQQIFIIFYKSYKISKKFNIY